MLISAVVWIVDFCARRHWALIVAGILLTSVAAAYDVAYFSINTDIEALISQDLPWHQRQLAMSHAFPQKGISVVVTAPTQENADYATDALAGELSKQKNLFPTVVQPDSGDFFERNGLLFNSLPEVRSSLGSLGRAEPLIAGLASDPSLRGLASSLSLVAKGVQAGEIQIDQLVWPLSLAQKTLSDVLSGRSAEFSWQELLSGRPAPTASLRHFIEVQPSLDYSADRKSVV